MERSFSLDEQILRYLTIKLDADAIEYLEKNKLAITDEIEVQPAVLIEPPAVEEIEDEPEEIGK
jgi:hypothetical protein